MASVNIEQDNKVVFSIRLRPEVKQRLERLKKENPDVSWELILEPVIKDVRLPKLQCASVKPTPKITPVVNYSITEIETETP